MTSRVDLHCHSTASQLSKLGVQRAVGLPECATPLTARFAGEPQAVHVRCWGIAPADHERLQELASDVEHVATYLHELRAGRVEAHGRQGSAAKWAHSAMALAVRTLATGDDVEPPTPAVVLELCERMLLEGDARSGATDCGRGPEDGRRLLRAWLDALGLERDPRALADALLALARRRHLRGRLARGGLQAVRDRSWNRALRQLADGYARALAHARPAAREDDAPAPATAAAVAA